jgi:hypothetical protein
MGLWMHFARRPEPISCPRDFGGLRIVCQSMWGQPEPPTVVQRGPKSPKAPPDQRAPCATRSHTNDTAMIAIESPLYNCVKTSGNRRGAPINDRSACQT